MLEGKKQTVLELSRVLEKNGIEPKEVITTAGGTVKKYNYSLKGAMYKIELFMNNTYGRVKISRVPVSSIIMLNTFLLTYSVGFMLFL